MTPPRYVELVRLYRAKLLLETAKWPFARITDGSGLARQRSNLGAASAVSLASLRKTIARGSDGGTNLRSATRYDDAAANYVAFVQLASIRRWLRVLEFTT